MTDGACEPQDWYKAMCVIDAAHTNVFFRDALPDEFGRILHSTYGLGVTTKTEEILITSTESLIVDAKSKCAYIVEIEGMRRDERTEALLARLKNKARQIGLKNCTCDSDTLVEIDNAEAIVLNKFLAGLSDDEIKEELIEEADLTLTSAIKIVTTHDMAKRIRAMMSGTNLPSSPAAAKVSVFGYL